MVIGYMANMASLLPIQLAYLVCYVDEPVSFIQSFSKEQEKYRN